ncbi:DNA topoisomerase 3 [Vairimorpha necatrix]|uniref:DNA topoisomerase n=1 Tax=Vairimorpha necatrix TaxID=6039 RepID=A0AAX4JBS9_9MICR
MLILNIAEKPSVAKSISKILSQNISTQRGRHKYCPNNFFKYNDDNFIFTSVLGHIYSINFHQKYIWESIDPKTLFYEPIIKNVQEEFLDLKKNIEEQALKSDKVIIWTDCDREGEHIALQISNIIKAKKNIEIKRARFSGIIRNDIINALNNLVDINIKEADAVDCRMEMDLRIGSSFTILQTLALKNLFSSKRVISFGPCQIPTLGFVVERYLQIEKFKEETFYSLELKTKNDIWSWKRGEIFDKNCVTLFHRMLSDKVPVVVKKEVKNVTKLKPFPLRTVEFQKLCSSIFKISSHKLMSIAESLYNKGYISYPRTETDSFDKKFNFREILHKIATDNEYSEVVDFIKENMKLPRSGKNNDMAHSPIYPLKGGNDLSGLDKSIYNFIVRRFLGGLCDDAKGLETYYELIIDKEIFYIKGLKVTERNFLDIYTFDKWNNKEIGEYEINKEIFNYDFNIITGKTTPPSFLTESDLITLMDNNGIGTDATIHEHIQKIQERLYATKVNNFIIPEKLGIGLIKGYNELNLSFSKPFLRKDLEMSLENICNGQTSKNSVLKKEVLLYSNLYSTLSGQIDKLKQIVEDNLNKENIILDKRSDNNNEGFTDNKKDNDNKKGNANKKDLKKKDLKKDNDNKKAYDKENKAPNKNPESSKFSNKDDIKFCLCRQPCQYSPMENVIKYKCGSIPVKCNFYFTEEIKCKCNFAPKILMSFTENNKNRKFFKCKKSYKPCNFFKWAESKTE